MWLSAHRWPVRNESEYNREGKRRSWILLEKRMSKSKPEFRHFIPDVILAEPQQEKRIENSDL
jgi:hypothetical protein